MMFFLFGDVFTDTIQVGYAYRKGAVSTLPCKGYQGRLSFFNPNSGYALKFLDVIGLGNDPTRSTQQMDMIFRTPNNDWRAFQFLRDTTRKDAGFPTNLRIL